MGLMLRKILNFLSGITRMVWFQLPMFVMLVVFMTAPTYFSGYYSYKTYLIFVLPQVILPALSLCWLASLKRWLWWSVFVLADLLFLVELGCLFSQHTRFNSVIAVLFMQTNTAEATEFINFAIEPISKALAANVAIAGFFALLDYAWRKNPGKKLPGLCRLNKKFVGCGIGAVFAFSVVYSPYFCIKAAGLHTEYWEHCWPMSEASNIVVYYYAFVDSFFNPDMRDLDKLENTINRTAITTDNIKDELTIVYVIGESFGRCRSSLFGYPFETNPMMTRELQDSSMFIFDNVISISSRTIDVYRQMLSTCDVLGDKPFVEYPLLPAILKKGDYEVAYYDNQSVLSSTKLDFACTYFLSNIAIREQTVDKCNDESFDYDGELVDRYPPLSGSAKSVTIYHLIGQHVTFNKRCPANFSYFSAADYAGLECYTEDQAKVMADYDNATRYNDFVLFQILNRLRDKVALLVYAPDHGEEAYDYRDRMGRQLNFPIESVRLLFEVPVMVWVSDKYKELYPQEVEMLRKNKHKAIYNSDLPHTIIDAAGIYTESFRPEVSLLREGPGRSNRRILQNNFEYDANRDRIRSFKMHYEK